MRLLRPSLIYSRPVLTALFGGLVVLIPLLALANILATSVTDGLDKVGFTSNAVSVHTQEMKLGHRISELSERIKHAEMLNRERKREIISLRTKIERLDQLSKLNISSNRPRDDIALSTDQLQIPAITHFLPHLLNARDPLKPAFRRVSGLNVRNAASIVFGVPSVKRPVESYLLSTIENLIANMSPEEASSAVIVVFIAEVRRPFEPFAVRT